jgi:Tol biopolymer transport system component
LPAVVTGPYSLGPQFLEDVIRTATVLLSAIAALPVLACKGPVEVVATPAMAVPPVQGETHLAHVTQLTHGGNNAEAYFSRSGKQLIFQRQPDVNAGCDQEFIMNIDGSGLHRISNGLGRTTCGYFYDNDKRILYSSTYEHDPACPARPDMSKGYVWPLGYFEIYAARADGSGLAKLTDDKAYNAEATVSPDGKRIIFTSTRDGDIDLYTMNIDGTDIRRLTTRIGYDGGAFFSPNGKQIVWRASYPVTAADSADYLDLLKQRLVRPLNLELWVANADGTNPRQVTHLGGANFAPFFSHDGSKIIFASNHLDPKGRNFDLFLINVDGTGIQQITHDPDFDGFPMFSPDGKKLVFASNRFAKTRGETNVFIADWVN